MIEPLPEVFSMFAPLLLTLVVGFKVAAEPPKHGHDEVIAGMDETEVIAACKASTEAWRDLQAKGLIINDELPVTSAKTIDGCLEQVHEFYRHVCEKVPSSCSARNVGGFVVWGPGLELNLPTWMRLPLIGRRADVRAVVGIAWIKTYNRRLGTLTSVRKIVSMVTLSQIWDSVRLPNPEAKPASRVQFVLPGLSWILVPSADHSSLRVEDLFVPAKPRQTDILTTLSELVPRLLFGAQFETRSTFETRWLQNGAFELSALVNAKGLLSELNRTGLTHIDSSPAVLISGFHSRGHINAENASVQAAALFEHYEW